MSRLTTVLIITGALVYGGTARADGELADSVLVKALKDEMARSLTLTLPDMGKPYFISYRVQDVEQLAVASEYGGLLLKKHNRGRSLRADVRVGDYSFDNTNFMGGGYGGFSTALPLDDDPDALRHAIWLATDRSYKGAAEGLVQKKAALANRTRDKDDPGDFSKEKPLKLEVDGTVKLPDGKAHGELVRRLSALFWKYPEVNEGYVAVSFSRMVRTLVTSEGTLTREPFAAAQFVMAAGTQADDGMPLAHYVTFSAPTAEQLPDEAALTRAVTRVLDELRLLRKAPRADDYSGPVLFAGKASGQVLQRLLVPNLSGTPPPKSSGGRMGPANDFEGRIGRRVMAKHLSVVDDPSLKSWKKQPLLGSYVSDDQGVRGQKLLIVDRGKLKVLPTSRTPSKGSATSNGHGRGFAFGPVRGGSSNVIVSSKKGLGEKKLMKRLVVEAKKVGEAYGVMITQLPNRMATGKLSGVSTSYGGYREAGTLAYKVAKGGKTTLVRGLSLGRMVTKQLKQVLAAGKKATVYHLAAWQSFSPRGASHSPSASLVAPALLMAEVELNKAKGGQTRPPLLPFPARGEKGAK